MKVRNLSEENSVFNTFIAELRDASVQQDRMRFRRNLERIGEVLAYEISKEMPFKEHETTTPLGTAKSMMMAEQPVVATILRAGLPLHMGILNYFDQADNSFISAYRRHTKGDEFVIDIEYLSSPLIDDRILVLNDPMLATGSSMVLGYQAMLSKGTPKHTHVVVVIASKDGVEYVKRNMPENSTLWLGAVDDELTAQSYIVPGLGDAGDLAFGSKE